MKLVDTTGRVQKFQDKYKNTKFASKTETADAKAAKAGGGKPADDKKGGEKK
jgi:hypothetical protein